MLSRIKQFFIPEAEPTLFSSEAYKNIEATWGDFIDDISGWDSIQRSAWKWLEPIYCHILYCDSCEKMQVSSRYDHNFGCRSDVYHIGAGRLLEIAVEKDCIGAIRLLKKKDVFFRPDEYIKSLQGVLKLRDSVAIIEVMDWRWFWFVLGRCENSNLTREVAISKYLAYVHEVLGAMFCNDPTLVITNKALAGQVLAALLPKKKEDASIWSQFMQVMDKKDFLTPIGTQGGARDVRRMLEEDFGVLWRPSTSELSRGQRDVIIDLAKRLVRENVGAYSWREKAWLRLVQRCRDVRTAICMEVMVLNKDIQHSDDPVGEQHIKRSSLETVCPNLGVGPSWWERVRHRYFACFSRRPKAKKSNRSWMQYMIPCVGGQRPRDEDDGYGEQLLPPKIKPVYRWRGRAPSSDDENPRIANTRF